MATRHAQSFKPPPIPFKIKKQGNPVSKITLTAGKRIGGAQKAEFARAQKRRDSKH